MKTNKTKRRKQERRRDQRREKLKKRSLLKDTLRAFSRDDCPRIAAALAFYAAFAIPPILILLFLTLGRFVDPEMIRGQILHQLQAMLGSGGVESFKELIRQVQQPDFGGTMATVLSIGAFILGATGSFTQVQWATNVIWKVRPDPEHTDVRIHTVKRSLSLLLIMVVALLVAASIMLSTVTQSISEWLNLYLPEGIVRYLIIGGGALVDYGMLFVLLMMIYKILPDAQLSWKDIRLAASVTTLLFVIGKWGIGFYLSQSHLGNLFGAAGSLAMLLMWIYLSAMLLFLGGEFAFVWALHNGRKIPPDKGAVRVQHYEEYYRHDDEHAGELGPIDQKQDHGFKKPD